ncbi:hypothetical protein [Streptomyces sp. NBC_01285]|uniref:hypothetical protein n=1 Tax=Streptomyces sp. NBC_01285 TaxID=2903813 RepID=UPI002255F373|nr:hypothetical protein [Streptomyces sp. NBC_01285]MCX4774021.1 hypothetical protein [Streptomyces sp. NBC_01285]
MREVTNPEERAALAVVPEIERTMALHADAKERFRKHRMGVMPDVARSAAIDEAVSVFTSGGDWPADVGTNAAKVYAEAQVWDAERLALKRAVEVTEALADDTRELLADDALAHLGKRLTEVLNAARAAADALGDVQSADGVIKAGGGALKAWSDLQGLIDDYRNVKAAQWEFLAPVFRRGEVAGTHEERGQLRRWRGAGYGHLPGSLTDVPADVLEALRTERYTVAALAYVSRIGTGYVPASFDDLKAEVESATAGPVYDDRGPMRDYSPSVTPLPEPRPSRTFSHSSTPQLDVSQPKPKPPTPNATVADPSPSTSNY